MVGENKKISGAQGTSLETESSPKVVLPIPAEGGEHYGLIDFSEIKNTTKDKTISLLNSPIAFPEYITFSQEISLDEAKEIVNTFKNYESFIGHPATAQLISEKLGVKIEARRSMFQPKAMDFALVFRLKKRLQKPEDIKNVKEGDIQVLFLSYVKVI